MPLTAKAFFAAEATGAADTRTRGAWWYDSQGNPRDGGQRTTNEGGAHQPKRLTAREGAASQSSSQSVEGTLSRFFVHRVYPFPNGRDSSAPALLYNDTTVASAGYWAHQPKVLSLVHLCLASG